MWKTIARFINEPIYQEFQFMKFYKANLENKDGKFSCSFGEKYLQNYSQAKSKKICSLKCKKNNFGFSCQEIEFLGDDQELTSWEEISPKDSKINKEGLKQEIEEKLKMISNLLEKSTNSSWSFRMENKPFLVYLECSDKPHLKFGITDLPRNQAKINDNLAFNHLKNIYVDLAKIDVYYLFKDIQERIEILDKLNQLI